MRLPIPPPPQTWGVSNYFFCTGAGTGAGIAVVGTAAAGAADLGALAGAPCRSSVGVDEAPTFLVATIDNEIEVSMKRIADSVVAFDSNVADPRGPKAV